MYNIIRLFIGCVFLMCSIAVIKKSKLFHKYILYALFIGISLAFIVVSAFLPFENLFVTFNSPKAAYEYTSFGKSNIELIVEGNDCDFVVDRKNNTDTYLIIPKTADGWKVGIGLNTNRIVQKFSDGIAIYVYQYKSTGDYFITILDTNGGESYVSDDHNTKFYSLQVNNNFLDKTFVTYYAHISNFNSKYSVIVNGNKIVLGSQQ